MEKQPTNSDYEPGEQTEAKGLTFQAAQVEAAYQLEENGICLFAFDIKNSRQYYQNRRQQIQDQLQAIAQDIEERYPEALPPNNLTTIPRQDKGFYFFADSGFVAVNQSYLLDEIFAALSEIEDVEFHFAAGQDSYDPNIQRLSSQ